MKKPWISVDEYVVDRNHADAGVERALREAVAQKAQGLLFGPGSYILNDFHTIDTLSAAHDDGQGDLSVKDVQLRINVQGDFHLKGTKGADGKPATKILGMNSGVPDTLLPTLFWAENMDALIVEDLAFGRVYKSVSTAEVILVEDGNIHVEMADTLPVYDQMGAYCMNRFDLSKKCLIGESLTYGFGYDRRWKKVGDKSLVLYDPDLSLIIKKGDGLSWHQSGKTDFLLFFGHIRNLQLKNIRVLDSNGFCILTEHCGDIHAEYLEIRPESPALFTGPRDGWKIYRCYGNIRLSRVHVEGVRMDGQNVHSSFMKVEKILMEDELLVSAKYAPTPLEEGTMLEFQRKEGTIHAEILSWSVEDRVLDDNIITDKVTSGQAVEGQFNYKNIYRVRLRNHGKINIEEGTKIIPQCWVPKSYDVSHSTFKNIAGAGQLLRARNIHITNCRYENILNAGILLGAELDVHAEGPHAEDVLIRDCFFIRCGTKPRYGHKGYGGISIASQGFSEPVNRRIWIENNHFSECTTAMEICDAEQVQIIRNTFHDVVYPTSVDTLSTRDITIDE